MADFTPDVQGPGMAWMIGRGAQAPDSLFGSISHVVAGAADKGIDIFRQYKGNDLQGQEGAELSQAVRDYSSGGQPLVGQTSNPAESDPGFKQAKGEIDLHAQAAQQGTAGSKQALMTRLSEITSRYASQNPYYAPQLQEYASKVLGFNANAELVNVASRAEDFQRQMNEGAQKTLIDKAVTAGGAHFNDDGSLDMKTTMLNGQTIVTEEHKAEVALAQSQLAQAQAKPLLTKDQTDDLEFRTVHPVAVSIADAATNGVFSQFAGMIGKAESGSPIEQPRIAALVAQSQQQAISQVTNWMDKHNIGNTTREQILADVKSRFSTITAVLGGDLSAGKQLSQALNRIKDTYGITFAQAAPHVYAATVIGGPQAAAVAVQAYTSPATTNPAYLRNKTEMDKYFNSPPTFNDAMKGSNGIMSGHYQPAQDPNPEKAKAALNTALPVLDHFSERPNKLSDKEQKSFGNIVRSASDAASVSTDPRDLVNAGTRLTRPGVVQGLIHYAKNPANANDAGHVLESYGTYLAKTQAATARVLTSGSDTRVVQLDGHRVGHSVSVHYSATTDGSGLAVPMFVAKDSQGRPVNLTPEQKSTILKQDPGFGRTLGVYNQTVKADQAIKSGLHADNQSRSEPKAKAEPKQKAEVSGALMEPARLDAFIAAHGGKIDAAIAAAPNDDVAQALADRYAKTHGIE